MHFDIAKFLATEGLGRTIRLEPERGSFFKQGGPADAVFYLQSGRGKLTVNAKNGKEATVTLLAPCDFFGEESMAGPAALRTSTAKAVSVCTALRIDRVEMLRTLHDEHDFSDFFTQFMLLRGIRTQADLVDQLFDSSERRLARGGPHGRRARDPSGGDELRGRRGRRQPLRRAAS